MATISGVARNQKWLQEMDITSIDNGFSQLGISSGSSEGAGILCGLICAKGTVTYDEWIAAMQDSGSDRSDKEAGSAETSQYSDANALLHEFYRETLIQMNDPEYDFELLLPHEDEHIGLRAEALAGWCRGFLYGLAMGGIKEMEHLPDDVAEISRDLVEFSKLSCADVEATESEESDYFELVEYVRMGVLLIYAELQPDHQQCPTDAVLH